MPGSYLIYQDETPGWEGTQWNFAKTYDGSDVVCPEGDPVTLSQSYDFRLNEGTEFEYECYEHNATISYRTPTGYGDALVCAHLQYNDPTNGIAGIIINGYWKIDDTTVGQMNLTMSSASSGELKTRDGTILSIPDNVNTLKGINRGATMPLVSSVTEGWYGARRDRTNTMIVDLPIPVFKNYDALKNYILNGDLSECVNLVPQFDTETNLYWIYCKYQLCQQVRGALTPVEGTSAAWHSQKFEANKMPTLYFASDNNYVLKLQARQVVASKATTTPGYILDNIPQSAWTLGELEYTGDYYGTINDFVQAKGKVLKDGQYVVSIDFQTNIPIFKNKAAADAAEENEDYTEAINDYDLTEGNTHRKTELGDEEITTLFGDGAVTSPFVAVYLCDRTDVLNIVNVFYTTNASVLDNIKEGLSLFGAQPYEALVSLAWFPFDVSDIVQTQPATSIWFGSYEHTGMSVKRVTSLISDYVDAGTVNITAPFLSYRDYDPYFEISVWLPYHGWEKLETKKYVGKSVNIRYYVDILTCTYIIALVISDGTNTWLGDTYSGNIGVLLPTCGNNLSQYANSMLQTIVGAGAGVVGGAVGGAMFGGGVGAAIGGMLGGAAGIAKGAFDIAQKPKPKDMTVTRGAFTAGAASYMPQYVIFRLDYHDLIVPENLTGMYGRPSSAAGTIGSFSGFLKVATAKLNTSGMSDYEIAELTQLLESGIFV